LLFPAAFFCNYSIMRKTIYSRSPVVIVFHSLMITMNEYHDSSQCSILIMILASLWGVEITYVAFDLYSTYAIEFVQATTLSRSSINTK
jgi:hypothetical protein